MKKIKFILAVLCISTAMFSQVGIQTATPSATLDIVSSGNTNTTKALEINNSSATEMVTVLDNGNVGIGTTTPSSKLTVAGTTLSENVVVGDLTGANPKQMIISYDITNNVGSIQPVHQLVGYTSLCLNPNGGNVGIGISKPNERLSVNVPLVVNAFEALVSGQNGTTTLNGIYSIRDGAGVQAGLAFKTYQNSVGVIEAVRISNNGNVGIGTTTPGQKLVVNGGRSVFYANSENYSIGVGYNNTVPAFWLGATASGTPDFLISNSGGQEIVRVTNGGRTLLRASNETFSLGLQYNSATGAYYIGATNSGTPDLVFSQVGGSEKMRLTDGGNLGIGTPTPVERLEVNGAVKVGTTASACNATAAGTIRWTGSAFEKCNGTAWSAF